MRALYLLTFFFPITIYSQLTYVPDDNLEEYFEFVNPLASNGVANDDSVLTAGLQIFTSVVLDGTSTSTGNQMMVYDFTGLEDCSQMHELIIQNQQTANIDLSNLTGSPSLLLGRLSIAIHNNNNLTSIITPNGDINTSIQSNPLLNNIQFQNSNVLHHLEISSNNSLTMIDISGVYSVKSGTNLTVGYNTYLCSLNLNNGACIQWNQVTISQNPSLYCIQVDDPNYSTLSTSWIWSENIINSAAYEYSNSCSCSTDIGEHYNLNDIKTQKVFDLLGRESYPKKGEVQILLLNDGRRKKIYITD